MTKPKTSPCMSLRQTRTACAFKPLKLKINSLMYCAGTVSDYQSMIVCRHFASKVDEVYSGLETSAAYSHYMVRRSARG